MLKTFLRTRGALRRLGVPTLLMAALLATSLAACSGSEALDPGEVDALEDGDSVTWTDTGAETVDGDVQKESTPACESDAQCLADRGAAPACQRWICDSASGCMLEALDNGLSCDDENGCTENDKCISGACAGGAVDCNDMNGCTTDSCDAASGCVHANNNASCDDGDLCTSDDHCQEGLCTGTAVCECTADADCVPFDDGDLCNGVKICLNQQCVTDPETVVDCSTAPAVPCQALACNPQLGVCETSYLADGTDCDDGSLCSLNDKCDAGACEGTPLNCDDERVCTDDACDPVSGCVYLPNTGDCDDGDLCTAGDICADGVCAGTVKPECQCTEDADCAPFDDGDLCNGALACIDGACAEVEDSVVICEPAADACQDVSCNSQSGECETKDALDGTSCDDATVCTTADVCKAGACVGAVVDCVDDNPCTIDGCNPETGCEFANNTLDCDDGNPCTTDDICAEGVCVGTDGGCDGCASDGDCSDVEDENVCNGTLRCVDGQCQVDPATVVTCPAPDGCTAFACQKDTGACVEVSASDGSACDDMNACTENTACQQGVCAGGAEVICDDDQLCTSDSCDPTVGCQYAYNSEPCDDGSDCTTGDVCNGGVCGGTPTADCVCTALEDCAAFDDGNPCTGTLVCVEKKCVVDPETVPACTATDPSGCTGSVCSAETGACEDLVQPDGKACDDGNACTSVDVCTAGQCLGGGAPLCDDANACTDDSCDPSLGCQHAFNAAGCDDGDGCTVGDACVEGLCVPGLENICGETCQPDWTLECGAVDYWDTNYMGATNIVDSYSCNLDDNYWGPEYTYHFTAPYNGRFTARLVNEDAITDVLVLRDEGFGCSAESCMDWDYSQLTFDMVEGEQYFVVVDGYEGAAGAYEVHLDCTAEVEWNCVDGQDDDDDGLIDCEDPDCEGQEACPLPQCDPGWTLDCGGVDSWRNYGAGSTDLLDDYACTIFTQHGPEFSYRFTAPLDGDVTVSLTGVTADLDLMVLSVPEGGECLAENCIASGDLDGDDTATFTASAGTTYYIVVDGYNGNQGSYTLRLDCAAAVTNELDCGNDIDDDEDGLTDCEDVDDCEDAVACAEPQESCQAAGTIGCGDMIPGATDSLGSTWEIDSYGSCSPYTYLGREVAYEFVAPATGTVTVALAEESNPFLTDVLILDGAEGCDPEACVAYGLSQAVFQAEEGHSYFIVVDSVIYDLDSLDTASEFLLTISCD